MNMSGAVGDERRRRVANVIREEELARPAAKNLLLLPPSFLVRLTI
jgi:hypothetical protein